MQPWWALEASFKNILQNFCRPSFWMVVYINPFQKTLLWYTCKHCSFFFCCVSGPTRDGTIGEDTIRASLVSAVSDKLRWRMKEEMDRAQAELDALKRTEEDLKRGHQKLEEMTTKLDLEMVHETFSQFGIVPFYLIDTWANSDSCFYLYCINTF